MNEISKLNWASMSDTALMEHIGKFIQHHRVQQNKTQNEVAKAAGVSRSTLSLLERGETVTLASLIQVLRVLDLLHCLDGFKVQNIISPISLARQEQQKRQRARSNKKSSKPKSDW